MNLTESVLNYRRYLKRKNYSPHTVKNYLHRLKRFMVSVPLELASPENVKWYIDFLLGQQFCPDYQWPSCRNQNVLRLSEG